MPTCNLGPNEDGGKGTGEDTSGKIDIPRKWQVLRGKGTGEQWEVSEIWQFFSMLVYSLEVSRKILFLFKFWPFSLVL